MSHYWCDLLFNRGTFLLPAIALVFAGEGQATAIFWSSAATISGDADVNTSGSLFGALVLGGTGTTTVNGVTFTGFNPASSGSSSGNFTITNSSAGAFSTFSSSTASAPFSTLSTSYKALLSHITYVDNPQTTTLTVSGLSVGGDYAIEFWWDISSFSANEVETANGGGGIVTVSSNQTSTAGGLGQFAIGTFTADSTSEAVTFSDSASGAPNGMNAFELRQTGAAAPEPSSLFLFLSAGLAMVGRSSLRGKPAPKTDRHEV
jgi:hypothetical protein